VEHRDVEHLHVENAELRYKYGIIFIVSLFCEYTILEDVRVPVRYRVNQAEYVLRIIAAVSHAYVRIHIQAPSSPPWSGLSRRARRTGRQRPPTRAAAAPRRPLTLAASAARAPLRRCRETRNCAHTAPGSKTRHRR